MQATEMEPAARERLLEALLDEFAAGDDGRVSIGTALSAARVSRAEFEAEFGDAESALKAAYETSVERLLSNLRQRCGETTAPWPRRVALGLEASLGELAADPAMAAALVRGFPSLSSAARATYERALAEFAALLRASRAELDEDSLPADVEMFAVGSAESIVADEVARGRAARLPDLAPEICFSVLVPFLGPTAAFAEMEALRRGL